MNKTTQKICKKYNQLSKQLKVSFWFTVSNIISNGIAYLTLPIFTRILSLEEYGMVTVFNSWNSIAMIFVTLNLSSGVFLSVYAKHKKDGDIIISSFQGLVTTIAIFMFGIYYLFKDDISSILHMKTYMILIMFVECVLTSSYNMWAMKLKYEFKYRLLILLSILMAILNPLLGIVLIKIMSNGGTARILSGFIIQIILYGGIYVSNARKGVKFFDITYWKYALGFGIPLIPHYLSLCVLNQSDRLMIANICGESESAIYAVGYNISCIINMLFSGINTAYGPWIMQKITERKYELIRNITNKVLLIIMGVTTVVLIVEPELIKNAATEKYYVAVWIMPSVTVGLFFSYLNNIFARVEFYYEKKFYIAFFSIFSAVLNISLNYIFIPRYGMIAAGYTTLVSYMVLCGLHFILYKIISKKEMNNAVLFCGKSILIMSSVIIIIMTLAILLINYPYIRYGIVSLVVLIIVLNYKRILFEFYKVKNESKA